MNIDISVHESSSVLIVSVSDKRFGIVLVDCYAKTHTHIQTRKSVHYFAASTNAQSSCHHFERERGRVNVPCNHCTCVTRFPIRKHRQALYVEARDSPPDDDDDDDGHKSRENHVRRKHDVVRSLTPNSRKRLKYNIETFRDTVFRDNRTNKRCIPREPRYREKFPTTI